jgi:biopolymer transport protein ExbB
MPRRNLIGALVLTVLLATWAARCTAQEAAPPAATTTAPAAAAETPAASPAGTDAPAAATATTTAEPAKAPAPGPADKELTLWQIIQWGGAIGYIIMLLSVVSVMLMVKQALAIRKKTLCPDATRDKIAALIAEKKLKEVVEFVNRDNTLLSRVLSVGFSRMRGGYSEMERAMSEASEDEAMRMEQSVGNFSLLANVAPLLGLLGTIVGMVFAFDKIAKDPAGAATPSKLAEPIEMALVTTVQGLVVAIPCVIAFSWFRNRTNRLLAETGLVIEDLMMPFRNLKPGQVKSVPAVAKPGESPEPVEEAKAKAEGDEPPTNPVETP